MNIEDIRKVKWFVAAIRLEKESEDDYLFSYDVNRIQSQDFKGKIRVDKSFFREIDEKGIWDECIEDGICNGDIALITPCSEPLAVYEEIPEYDYWMEILVYKYLEQYVQDGKLLKLMIIEHHIEEENNLKN